MSRSHVPGESGAERPAAAAEAATVATAPGEEAVAPEETAAAPPRRPAGFGPVAWLRWGWRTLTSMRTALILLFLFAVASVPGSIFPQRGVSPEKVAEYFRDSPALAEWLDRLYLFDVFQAPWYAAIYLLLFVSLLGCVLPRSVTLYRELRRRPPAAPRNLSRLPRHAAFHGEAEVAELAAHLRRKGFRVATGPDWVAGEKGYLREVGNLLFHFALIGILVAVGVGAVYGYRGNVLVVEGEGFANTVAVYDRFQPGRLVTADSLAPFTFTLRDFQATYQAEGERQGQALDYVARLGVTDRPGAPERAYDLRVNEPLNVDGTQTYLLNHGYAPVVKVTDGEGQVAFEGPVPCLPVDQRTLTSECVIKVPDARPRQLGFLARFLPSTASAEGGYVSVFPAAINPTVQIWAFSGDLGLDDGVPQSVYQLDTDKLQPLVMQSDPLQPGQRLTLPDGAGTIEFTGVKEWITLQITYDPGRLPALVSAVVATVALVLSLVVRRRRVWIRVSRADGPATIEVGGLARTEGNVNFTEEFDEIVGSLRGRFAAASDERPATAASDAEQRPVAAATDTERPVRGRTAKE
ncbi:cytochrome c biosynthesis protein [Thermopolyspora flexuosa]|uniref:Cytochrome c biogenesis protein n=1 Tax=Thermopolyspora flexuosa TaxID=103836 RepID=A0A543J3H1_9ACTN|nr:cytochrome c biogenesis protein ResB [Thermopolyspora flexuosa]TQM77364.1 cytochrome c biogenesis protein [Thermopolyspora flexuosa]GGM73958.1 cytochrome c biosynthesis protein [Thermopolyspora flexuosa]